MVFRFITSFYFNFTAKQFIKSYYSFSIKGLSLSNKNNQLFFFKQALQTLLFTSMIVGSFFMVTASATQLIITDNLVLRDIDDKAIEQGFFSKKQSISLSQGDHTLVLKYKDVFEDLDMGEESLVKSDYFVVKFVVQEQKALMLSTGKIQDLAAAERFAKNPELILLDEDKQEIILVLEKLSDYELAKQITQVVTTLSAPIDNAQSHSEVTSVTKKEQTFSKDVINQVDAMPMLKYWWKKASSEEKANFLQFINKKN